MTISSTTRKAGPYAGDGVNAQFAFAFKVFSASDVLVVQTDLAGVESNLTLTTHYTVSLNADQDASPGGTVTLLSAPATGYKIILTSAVQSTQGLQIPNQGGFHPNVLMAALDKLTILVQQVSEQVGRAVKVGISSATSPDQLISTLLTAVSNALGYSNAASASATAAANSATAAGNSATAAANSATAAAGYVVPSQTGHSGALITNGSSVSWLDSPFAFRNKIINGDMRIDQRQAGASVTITNGAALTYITDRWGVYGNVASKISAQQNAGSVTPPAGFKNYLGVTSLSAYALAANDTFCITQRIEGYNVSDLAYGTANAQAITMSFWVRSSLTGTFGGSVQNAAQNRVYAFSYVISQANTWEYKTITIPGDTTGTWATDNSIGLLISFSLGAGSNFSLTPGSWGAVGLGGNYSATGTVSIVGTAGATFNLTGVQVEKGSIATPFEFRPIDKELQGCHRYAKPPGYMLGQCFSNSSGAAWGGLPSAMRATPTLSTTSGWTVTTAGGGSAACTVIAGGSSDPNTVRIDFSGAAGAPLVSGNATVLVPPAGALLVAEL